MSVALRQLLKHCSADELERLQEAGRKVGVDVKRLLDAAQTLLKIAESDQSEKGVEGGSGGETGRGRVASLGRRDDNRRWKKRGRGDKQEAGRSTVTLLDILKAQHYLVMNAGKGD